MSSRRWNDLGAREKAAVIGVSLAQITLLVAALTDIYRRPAEQVRGRKLVWTAASFINFIGPITYFLFGRKKQDGS